MSTETYHTEEGDGLKGSEFDLKEPRTPDSSPQLWESPYWSGLMTTIWAGIIIFFWAVTQTAVALGVVFTGPDKAAVKDAFSSGDQTTIESLLTRGDAIWAAALASSIIGVLIVLMVIRARKGATINDYLALKLPPAKTWLMWTGIFLGFSIVLEFAARNIEALESDFMQGVLDNTSNLPMLILTIGVIGPIFEEVVFRGFIFRGWSETVLGGHGTVILTATIFAFMHFGQYSLPVVLAIIPMGLLFGYARMYSGSLWIPIVLHIINNLVASGMGISEMGV